MASVSAMALQLQRLSNQATRESFQYNTKEANTARTWQKMMSDTSHQREVEDLKKAGLNPILSSGGAGAQSYTTSSASAAAENAANAVGGLYQSKISADATRAAAAQSAAAMRAAAATQAAAAQYSANMQYKASVFHSQKAYEASKYQSDMKYKIEMNKPASNPFTLADKYLTKAGVTGGILSGLKSIKFNKNMFETPKSGNTITANNFQLNKQGIAQANRGLNKLHLANTRTNQKLYVQAFQFGSSSAMKQIQNMIYANNRRQSSIRKTFNNSKIWRSSI